MNTKILKKRDFNKYMPKRTSSSDFQCEHCTKFFANKQNLDRHVRSRHAAIIRAHNIVKENDELRQKLISGELTNEQYALLTNNNNEVLAIVEPEFNLGKLISTNPHGKGYDTSYYLEFVGKLLKNYKDDYFKQLLNDHYEVVPKILRKSVYVHNGQITYMDTDGQITEIPMTEVFLRRIYICIFQDVMFYNSASILNRMGTDPDFNPSSAIDQTVKASKKLEEVTNSDKIGSTMTNLFPNICYTPFVYE